MKENFFKVLIVVMSLSIIGLVIVQLYWLNSAFVSGKNDFDSHVYKALDATTEEIKENELSEYYNLFKPTINSLKDSTNKTEVVVSQIERDSASVKYIYITRYMLDKVAIPVSNQYNDSLNITEYYSAERPIKIRKDSTSKDFQPLDINLESNFRNGTYSLERFAQFDAGNKPIQRRINIETLDSIFRKKLAKYGIKTDFDIAVLNSDSTLTKVKSDYFVLSPKDYTAPLFEGNNGKTSYYLSVYFPKKNSAIFGSISGLFLITLLFTLVILGVYSVSIWAMMRQRKISQMKTDFINNMTHEFKTPLATISVATDALKSKTVSTDPNKVKHYANVIKQENKRMNSQVEMVLRTAKLERNEVYLDKKKENVDDIVKESVDSIRLIVEQRNGTIIENYDAVDNVANVDGFHLGNIILNVLDNATKYSPEKPEIKVHTYNENGMYVIAISDKGIGMSKSVQNKIFDKFYREETGNIHNVKGHGLGLSYVKYVTEKHGGEVSVESEKNVGSTFYIKIPLKN